MNLSQTPEQRFRERWPNAYAEQSKTDLFESYWSIWNRNPDEHKTAKLLAVGDTAELAWIAAIARCLDADTLTPEEKIQNLFATAKSAAQKLRHIANIFRPDNPAHQELMIDAKILEAAIKVARPNFDDKNKTENSETPS